MVIVVEGKNDANKIKTVFPDVDIIITNGSEINKGTINDIKREYVVEFNGEILKIGEFLASIRKQHRLYQRGDKKRGAMSRLSLERYQVLDSLNFEWEPQKEKTKEENDICTDSRNYSSS